MTNEARIHITKQFKDLSTDDTDIFLPKVRKLRPDGASLAEVYRSKQQDVWGKIAREQLHEEEENNQKKHRAKELADSTYGARLREQIQQKHLMEANQHHHGDFMVNAKGGTVGVSMMTSLPLLTSLSRAHPTLLAVGPIRVP
jgi:hypothetical protein